MERRRERGGKRTHTHAHHRLLLLSLSLLILFAQNSASTLFLAIASLMMVIMWINGK